MWQLLVFGVLLFTTAHAHAQQDRCAKATEEFEAAGRTFLVVLFDQTTSSKKGMCQGNEFEQMQRYIEAYENYRTRTAVADQACGKPYLRNPKDDDDHRFEVVRLGAWVESCKPGSTFVPVERWIFLNGLAITGPKELHTNTHFTKILDCMDIAKGIEYEKTNN